MTLNMLNAYKSPFLFTQKRGSHGPSLHFSELPNMLGALPLLTIYHSWPAQETHELMLVVCFDLCKASCELLPEDIFMVFAMKHGSKKDLWSPDLGEPSL